MPDSPQNTSLADGVRAFYEQSAAVAAPEMPGFTWPAYGDLNAEQRRAWMLALASTAETAVRVADAFVALGFAAEEIS